jgi:hypothetical protein
MNRRQNVPTLQNPNWGSININQPESADASISKLVAENAERIRRECITRLSGLPARFLVARRLVLSLRPMEPIPDFKSIDGIEHLDRDELERREAEYEAAVEQLEARAVELEADREANLTEMQQLRVAIDRLTDRIARLENGRATEPVHVSRSNNLPRSDVPQLLAPNKTLATAAHFGGAPANSGTRRIG